MPLLPANTKKQGHHITVLYSGHIQDLVYMQQVSTCFLNCKT